MLSSLLLNKSVRSLRGIAPNHLGRVARGGSLGNFTSSESRMSKMSKTALSSSEEDSYKKSAADEIIEIVDIDNKVLDPCKRSVMREKKLIHRATYALVKDSSNYFYVQKRSKLKDYCPGFWDPTPGGVVAAGESYEETNKREVEEEMGVPISTPMTHMFDLYYEDERIKCWGDCWEITYDGPLRLQLTEVEEVEKMSMEEILTRFDKGEPFTPDGIAFCREYVKRCGRSPSVMADKPTMPDISFY